MGPARLERITSPAPAYWGSGSGPRGRRSRPFSCGDQSGRSAPPWRRRGPGRCDPPTPCRRRSRRPVPADPSQVARAQLLMPPGWFGTARGSPLTSIGAHRSNRTSVIGPARAMVARCDRSRLDWQRRLAELDPRIPRPRSLIAIGESTWRGRPPNCSRAMPVARSHTGR